MKRKLCFLTLVLMGMSRLHAAEPTATGNDGLHAFTNSNGQGIKARIVSASGDDITIRREDGQQFAVKLSLFSEADRIFVKEWNAAKNTPGLNTNAKVSVDAMNEAAGQPVFAGSPLWEEKPEDVAARLKWPRESNTKFISSFRSYPKEAYRFLGARPYSAVLYAEDGKATGMSLVYANKGDLFGKEKSGGEKLAMDKDNLSRLDDAISADVETISAVLTKALGPPKQQRFGDGAGRRKVSRWDWKGHAFLLQDVGREYVSLTIDEIAFADAGGKVVRVPQTVIRARAKENVERRPNGDVVVTNVPMVVQGPKGYCAPSTCERAMRYVGLPADMYILAMVGKSGLGGGTSVMTMLNGMKADMQRKGRNFITWEGPLKLQSVTRYIDAGIPIMWALYSTDPFNKIAWDRTKERKTITNWADWKTRMHSAAKTATLSPDEKHAHVAMVIGYNKETGEIAISDSWGERAAERWVTMAEAEQVSQHAFYVVGL